MTTAGEKEDLIGLFDALAEGYDRAALRFFPFAADRLAQRLAPQPGEKILDLATGTGAVAVAVGQRLGGGGRVMAIDISEKMLDRAFANVRRMALHNIDLHAMDAAALEFRAGYFDALACSFGLFFLSDMPAALREWRRVLRPGGRLHLTSFGAQAFQPLAGLFCDRLSALGGPALSPAEFPWQRLANEDGLCALLVDTGFDPLDLSTEQLGFHLQSPQEWWEILWHTGFRRALLRFDAEGLEAFRQQHLEEVEKRFVDGKFWLDVPVIFVSAKVAD